MFQAALLLFMIIEHNITILCLSVTFLNIVNVIKSAQKNTDETALYIIPFTHIETEKKKSLENNVSVSKIIIL